MTEENKGSSKSLVKGVIIGSIVGAITALLLAPKKGSELRSDIKEQYDHVSEKSKEVATKVGKKTQEVAETVSEKSQVIAGKAKDLATTATKELKAWKENRKASDSAEEVQDEIAATKED